MSDNVKEFKQSPEQRIAKDLAAIGAEPLIVIAVSEEEGMVVINRAGNPMEAIGFLEAAKVSMIMTEGYEDE